MEAHVDSRARDGGRAVELHGIHHVSCVTRDAQRCVDFYVGLLGLRLVKRTVNFDDPSAYHLYLGDESGSPGSLITFFEYPRAVAGRAGPGAVSRLRWRVGSEASLAFWAERLGDQGVVLEDGALGALRFRDPEGLEHELAVESASASLAARAADVPQEHALRGLAGVVARTYSVEASRGFLEPVLGFERAGPQSWTAGAAGYAFEAGPAVRPVLGAGSVHHVAWCVEDDAELESWRLHLSLARAAPTPVIDRQYFHSVYFSEQSGVLFELATLGPGFAVDEPPDRLGQELRLPARFELLRTQLEGTLAPISDPRASVRP